VLNQIRELAVTQIRELLECVSVNESGPQRSSELRKLLAEAKEDREKSRSSALIQAEKFFEVGLGENGDA
jgi:hypothetical protein